MRKVLPEFGDALGPETAGDWETYSGRPADTLKVYRIYSCRFLLPNKVRIA
jgi:hypothetical protein